VGHNASPPSGPSAPVAGALRAGSGVDTLGGASVFREGSGDGEPDKCGVELSLPTELDVVAEES
jgi:hypothetical protein